MKKRNLNQKLKLSKSTVSSLKLRQITGGTQDSDCLCNMAGPSGLCETALAVCFGTDTASCGCGVGC